MVIKILQKNLNKNYVYLLFMQNFKSGKYINQGFYKSFQPEFIHRNWEIQDMSVLQLLSQAGRQLGRLCIQSM